MTQARQKVEAVISAVEASGEYSLSEEGVARIRAIAEEYVLWSAKMHIVSRGDRVGRISRQIVDSLAMLRFATAVAGKMPRTKGLSACKVADIGSGYGFPPIVWAAAEPDLDITMIERKQRAANFLERMSAKLGAGRLRVIRADAASAGRDGEYSVVTSKAAGRLPAVLPVAGRLLGPEGIYVSIKGRGWKQELLPGRSAGFELLETEVLDGDAGTLVAFMRK